MRAPSEHTVILESRAESLASLIRPDPENHIRDLSVPAVHHIGVVISRPDPTA